MTSNGHMMLYDRGGESKSGMLEFFVMDVGLAQEKFLSMQIEDIIVVEIKKWMTSLNIQPQLAAVKLLEHTCYDYYGGEHTNGAREIHDDDTKKKKPKEVNFVGNNGKKTYHCSSTYNPGWKIIQIFHGKINMVDLKDNKEINQIKLYLIKLLERLLLRS